MRQLHRRVQEAKTALHSENATINKYAIDRGNPSRQGFASIVAAATSANVVKLGEHRVETHTHTAHSNFRLVGADAKLPVVDILANIALKHHRIKTHLEIGKSDQQEPAQGGPSTSLKKFKVSNNLLSAG